jgi:elongation of very long chain fatty acids protein 6
MKNLVLNPTCSDSILDSCISEMTATDSYLDVLSFDAIFYREWFARNWHLSIYASIIYIIAISYGEKWMKNRKPFDLKSSMVLWNLSLSCFSLFGSIKILPELVSALYHNGFYYSVCNNSFLNDKSIELWIWLFTWSKVFEFGDTVFIILRKHKLIFLHWIHHVITLIYCFFIYDKTPAISRWGVSINYTIHAIMYFYYALKIMKFSIPNKASMAITLLQTIQMVIGMITAFGVLLYVIKGVPCDGSLTTALATFFMSLFYFVLFVKFFAKRYFTKYSPQKSMPLGKSL